MLSMSIKKYKSRIILVLIIFSILFFIFLINILVKKNNYEKFNNQSDNQSDKANKYMTYYRCKDKMLGKIVKSIFDNNNIIQSDDDWNIYIPCGYNNVESELKTIKNKNINNKYIFGLNGCDSIVSKNEIWNSLMKCYGRKYASTLMPESYILGDPNEMMLFRKNFDPSGKDIYIMKKNLQRKEGLKLTKDFFEILEGRMDDYRVVQKYIRNLYLINDRKVNLRVYLLIVIKDSMVYFYLSDIGKCIYTNKKYNDNDFDFESNITSYHLDMSVYKENPRNFDELKKYIDDKNNSKNDGKNGDLLFQNIELLIRDVSKCLSNNVYQSENIEGSVTFQLFGGDIIFDTNLHPFLLEFNKGPDMTPRDNIDEQMKYKVQKDMFNIAGIIPNDNGYNSFKLVYKTNMIKK
jgi:hypothetical protein